MKLDLDDYNVIELTAGKARDLFDALPDDPGFEDLGNELDEAQGPVFSGQSESRYLIIKIVKGE